MSCICDVCGPKVDFDSIFCSNCGVGIIYEIKTNDSEILERKPDISPN
jgi:hypothetical protein